MTIPDSEKIMDNTKEKKMPLCKKKKVLEAIRVLKELSNKFMEDETKKQPLLEEATESPVLLQITMKKVPPKRMSKRIRVSLPHSMMLDTTEVCVFTGDLDKRDKKAEIDPDILHYKELLKKKGITNVSEVITLRQLRTEYKVYEAKRQLMAAYDVFLCDKKIAQCLPRLLGKTFYKKRKFPIQINMDTPHLKNQVDKALSETVFTVNSRGNNCTSEVARLGMNDEEILENILAAVKVLGTELPGEQENIFGIYIKTAKSQAIPIFISFGNPTEVKFKQAYTPEKVDLEELSTLPDAKVKVFRNGKIVVQMDRAHKDEKGANRFKSHWGKKNIKKDFTEGNSDAGSDAEEDEASTQSEEESESLDEIIEEDSNKTMPKQRKSKSNKNATKNIVKIETSTENEESEEIEEEDTNKSKTTKRKSKGNVKNETSIKIKESEEIEEEDTNKSKTPKRKSKGNITKENVKNETSIKIDELKEIEEEDTNKSKTPKRKSKGNVKNETSIEIEELEEIEEDTNKSKTTKRKSKGNVTKGNVKNETSIKIEELQEIEEQDTNKSKTPKRKSKGNITKGNVKNETSIKIEESEEIEEDTNKSKLKRQKAKIEDKKDLPLEFIPLTKLEESMVETDEKNNKSKTRRQSKRRESKKNFTETEASIPKEESMVEIIEEDANKSKTRKRKAPETLEDETLEPTKVQKIKSLRKRQSRVKS